MRRFAVVIALVLAGAGAAGAEVLDYGTFGEWVVHRTGKTLSHLCTMVQTTAKEGPSIAFSVVPREGAFAVLVQPEGFGPEGRQLGAMSTVNEVRHTVADYRVDGLGMAESRLDSPALLRSFADDIVQGRVRSWRIDAPDLGIVGLPVPLAGFSEAVRMLADYSKAIGAPF